MKKNKNKKNKKDTKKNKNKKNKKDMKTNKNKTKTQYLQDSEMSVKTNDFLDPDSMTVLAERRRQMAGVVCPPTTAITSCLGRRE